jgi:hypothetical protein
LRTWYILVISQVKKCPALRGPWRANRKCDVKAIASGANPSGLGRGVQRNDGPVFKTKGGESFRAPHCRKERYSPARRLTIAERLLRCRDHDQLALCRPGSLGVPAPGVSDFEAQGVLALSTPHENTDVKKLLKKLRDFFSRKVFSNPSPKSLKPQSWFMRKWIT